MTQKLLKYEDARPLISSGDIGLQRGNPIFSIFGRSEYSHALMFVWHHRTLLAVELREWYGGRIVTAERLVGQSKSGSIDVYRPAYKTSSHAERAAEAMIRKAGEPYNYRGILLGAAFRIPILNLIWRPDLSNKRPLDVRTPGRFGEEAPIVSDYPEYCSAAVCDALRAGGVEAVQNLGCDNTEPGDLGRSTALTFKFTID